MMLVVLDTVQHYEDNYANYTETLDALQLKINELRNHRDQDLIVSLDNFDFFHLHEIVEGLYFHCSLSVCLCVLGGGVHPASGVLRTKLKLAKFQSQIISKPFN